MTNTNRVVPRAPQAPALPKPRAAAPAPKPAAAPKPKPAAGPRAPAPKPGFGQKDFSAVTRNAVKPGGTLKPNPNPAKK